MVKGCTHPNATNAVPGATPGNPQASNCSFPILGCMSPSAVNYNSVATKSDPKSCERPKIRGCTNTAANNFQSDAQEEDGSCKVVVFGCIIARAINFDSTANTLDSKMCVFPRKGCMDSSASNYSANATLAGNCTYLA